jgi:hypothetical protein
MAHKINHLSFGDRIENIVSVFGQGEQTNFNHYDGITKNDH